MQRRAKTSPKPSVKGRKVRRHKYIPAGLVEAAAIVSGAIGFLGALLMVLDSATFKAAYARVVKKFKGCRRK